jgi:hypothetical protein
MRETRRLGVSEENICGQDEMCFSVKVVDDYGEEEGAFAEWAYGLRCIIDYCLTPYNILSYLT